MVSSSFDELKLCQCIECPQSLAEIQARRDCYLAF